MTSSEFDNGMNAFLNRNTDLDPLLMKTLDLTAKGSKTAGYFFFISGFSILNTFLVIAGGKNNLYLDLGTNQLIMKFTHQLTSPNITASIVLYIALYAIQIAIGLIFILIGFAARDFSWKISLAGLLIYLIDGLILLFTHGPLAVLLHIWFIYKIWGGFRAMKEYDSLVLELKNNITLNSSEPP